MTISTKWKALWIVLFFSPFLIAILHDSVLCYFAPLYGISGGDGGGCTLGWAYLGVFASVAISLALLVAVVVVCSLGFWITGATTETRYKIVKIVMWIPLAAALFFDGSIITSVAASWMRYHEAQALCDSAKPILTIADASAESVTLDFSKMPTHSALHIYDGSGKIIVTQAFMQQESGELVTQPVGADRFAQGEYRLVAYHGYGDQECPIGETSFQIK
jgi:hypothetical protein